MSVIVINLALIFFTLSIIAVGLQVMLLPENRLLLQKKVMVFKKLSNHWYNKGSAISQQIIKPVSIAAETKIKTPPTKFEKEISQQFINAFKILTGKLKILAHAAFKVSEIIIIIGTLGFLTYYIINYTLVESPQHLISDLEEVLSKTTTPLLKPLINKFLD